MNALLAAMAAHRRNIDDILNALFDWSPVEIPLFLRQLVQTNLVSNKYVAGVLKQTAGFINIGLLPQFFQPS